MPDLVNWNPREWEARVQGAAFNTLDRVANDAHSWWDLVAPVGDDPRTSGDLKGSWFSNISSTGNFGQIVLHIGASVRYAIYVELGTGRMAPRAPLRTVAGEVFPLIEYYLYDELNH